MYRIGGKLWNRKYGIEKDPGLYALSRSLSHELCPVRDCSAPVVPRQEEISGAATELIMFNFGDNVDRDTVDKVERTGDKSATKDAGFFFATVDFVATVYLAFHVPTCVLQPSTKLTLI